MSCTFSAQYSRICDLQKAWCLLKERRGAKGKGIVFKVIIWGYIGGKPQKGGESIVKSWELTPVDSMENP